MQRLSGTSSSSASASPWSRSLAARSRFSDGGETRHSRFRVLMKGFATSSGTGLMAFLFRFCDESISFGSMPVMAITEMLIWLVDTLETLAREKWGWTGATGGTAWKKEGPKGVRCWCADQAVSAWALVDVFTFVENVVSFLP